MTVDVVQELERYGSYAESAAPALDVESVLATRKRPTPTKSPRLAPPSPRFGFAVALVAAVLTLVIIGAVTLLDPFSVDLPVVDTPPPTTAPAEAVDPTPVEAPVWSTVFDSDFDLPGSIEGLTQTSVGWVAVGSVAEAAGATTPAMWVSADGLEWNRVVSDAFDDARGVLRGVADHTGRLVVVGVDSDTGRPAFWQSNAGFNWQRLAVEGDVFGPIGAEITSIAVPHFAGYVAVGSHSWTSPDGLTWERHEFPDGLAFSLLEFPDGLLAGGVTKSTGTAAIWISGDYGTNWSAAQVESRFDLYPSTSIRSLAQTDTGYVAVGHAGDDAEVYPAIWTSKDGHSWQLVWVADDGAYGSLLAVAHSAGQTVAVGERLDGGQGAVWLSSDDGASWVEYDDRQGLFDGGQATTGSAIWAVEPGEGGAFVAAGIRKGEPGVWHGTRAEKPPETDADGRPLLGWTCQARIDNDAVWELGHWDEEAGHYVATGVTPCLDLLEIHFEPQIWKVEWTGSSNKLEVGFLLWFERGIHGTVFAQKESSGESGEWLTPIITPDPTAPFTFVAMPHSFDDWEEITWTVTPCAATGCN